LAAIRREIVQKAGRFRSEFDGAQDYDLFLRITERTNRIYHVPRVLYHWRRSEDSSAAHIRQKPGQLEAGRFAIEDHLRRRNERAHVLVDWRTHAFHVRRELAEAKKISIIIAAGHNKGWRASCLEAFANATRYPNYEIVVLKGEIQSPGAAVPISHVPHRVLPVSDMSNNGARNFAAKQVQSPWLLFLDDAVEPIPQSADWLTIMAEHVRRAEVGAVGARLLNRDETIEHAGTVIGIKGIAQPAFRGFPAEHLGVSRQLQITRNCTAVSGACMLIRREIFEEMDGFDETLPESVTDVDLCLKIRQAGYLIVYTPFAKLYWERSSSGSIDGAAETIMRQRWGEVLQRDPYYNPNLSRQRADFSLAK
jgi:GT2 family glycosyltransferase